MLSSRNLIFGRWFVERAADILSANPRSDQLEELSLEEGKAFNDRLKPLCRGKALPDRSKPVEWIMFDIWENLRSTDPSLADEILGPLFRFMDAQTSKSRLSVDNISTYLEYRQDDVGQGLVPNARRQRRS